MRNRNTPALNDKQTRRDVENFLATNDAEAGHRLFWEIREFARRVIRGGSPEQREEFIDSAPVNVLFPRDRTGTSRLQLFNPHHAFYPWLAVVLKRLWMSRLPRSSRTIVNTELVLDATQRSEPDSRGLPELTLNGQFTPEFARQLMAATTLSRLVVFLVMADLHREFPGWEDLVQKYEAARPITLPRPFPSLAVELRETPRTRTAPLARELGFDVNNTLTQIWVRACQDIRAAFPELARFFRSPSRHFTNRPSPRGCRASSSHSSRTLCNPNAQSSNSAPSRRSTADSGSARPHTHSPARR